MARSKGSKSRGRVTAANAKRSLPLSDSYILSPFDRSRQLRFDFLRTIEDRRTYHPEGPQRPARGFQRARHRLTLAQPARPPQRLNKDGFARLRSLGDPTRARVVFDGAPDVLVCVRRQRRKEVLHALRKAGKRGQRRPRRSWYSKVSCKK